MDSIFLFGDSLTQGGWQAGGFAQRLAYLYARRLDIVNRGLSGYNTEWAMPVFEKTFPKKGSPGSKVRLLVLWWGANDSCLRPSPQCLPLDKFVANLKTMISMVRSPESEWHSPDTKIILVTPPPMSEAMRKADLASRDPPIELDRTAANTELYVDAVIALGKELDLPVIDMYEPIWAATGNGNSEKLQEYLSDGLHLTTAGYTIIYDQLLATIKANFPELYQESIPMVFPQWKDIDWENPRSSFK